MLQTAKIPQLLYESSHKTMYLHNISPNLKWNTQCIWKIITVPPFILILWHNTLVNFSFLKGTNRRTKAWAEFEVSEWVVSQSTNNHFQFSLHVILDVGEQSQSIMILISGTHFILWGVTMVVVIFFVQSWWLSPCPNCIHCAFSVPSELFHSCSE